MQKIEHYYSGLNRKQLLEYLADLNLVTLVTELIDANGKTIEHNLGLHSLPAGVNRFRNDIDSLEGEKEKFRITLQTPDCPHGVYDSILFLRYLMPTQPSYSICGINTGITPVCKECGRYSDPQTYCGKYAKRKAERIESGAKDFKHFQEEVLTGRQSPVSNK